MQNKGYNGEFLAELKSKSDIVSTVSRYVQLERKGSKYWACCPFHHEKTPSFTVNETEQLYYCFGCKESGDVITFIEKMEGLNFVEAIELLAENAGMEVPEFTGDNEIKKQKQQKERILKILDVTYKHYIENLYKPQAKLAQEYIKSRGLSKNELESFKIGYSINWNEMIDYLKSKGFSFENMTEAGICQVKDGRAYDVMGERLIFPIFNSYGECIAFSARILVKSDYAKYKNTIETVVFSKRKTVYGIHIIRKLKQEGNLKNIIVVEGQMDVIAMHRAGFRNTVACLGTAITEEHARELKRFSDDVILCLDGDEAGIKATVRSIDVFKSVGLNVKVVKLPSGRDPDEIIKSSGSEAITALLENAILTTDYLIDEAMSRYNLEDAEEKSKFIKECCNIIKKLDTSSLKDIYLKKIKNITKLPLDVLRRDLEIVDEIKPVKKENVLTNRENGNIKAIKYVLASMLYKKDYANTQVNLNELLDTPLYKKIYQFILEKKPLSMLYDEFDVENEPLIKDLIGFNFEEYKGTERQSFNECLWTLKEIYLNAKQLELNENFKNSNDSEERRKIAKELFRITNQLKNKSLEDF